MTVGLAPAVANGFLNALTRAANYTAPVAFFVKHHVGDPGVAGASNPASNTTRVAITFGTAATGGAIANTAAASWTNVPASEDYTHWSSWDASTAGNFTASGTTVANPVVTGDTFTVPIGAMTLTMGTAA